MMRSMYSGVSGLRVHQTKMDVIGNNIANVNTVGYKKGQVSFQEVFSQVIRGAGAPQEGKGGTNPQQLGLGVKLGNVNTVHTKGATQRTDNPTDLMIDGDGYFVVSDDANFENKYYTRAGNFSLDKDGFLVTADGFKVLGLDKNEELSAIRINKSETVPSNATSALEVRGNIDSRLANGLELFNPTIHGADAERIDLGGSEYVLNDEGVVNMDTNIKDQLGNSYKLKFKIIRDAASDNDTGNAWKLTMNEVVDVATGESINITPKEQTIIFDQQGSMITGSQLEIDFDNPKSDGYSFASYFGEYDINTAKNGYENDNKISIDLSKITQFSNASDIEAYEIANSDGEYGRSSGSLDGFSIDSFGVITGAFTNGMKEDLGQIALAKFDNSMGLQKQGSNMFVDSPNSGKAQIGSPGNSGLGAVTPGALEMSNVDISMEFTEMITTQRGFQANSRIITTTDEMLQELVNMKR